MPTDPTERDPSHLENADDWLSSTLDPTKQNDQDRRDSGWDYDQDDRDNRDEDER